MKIINKHRIVLCSQGGMRGLLALSNAYISGVIISFCELTHAKGPD